MELDWIQGFNFGLPYFYSQADSPHDKIIIAIIGNISDLKDQKELINALKKLSPQEMNNIE